MTANSLAQRIRANRKSRSPVQDTVEQHFDEITACRNEGISFEDIHVRLTREGHNVGRKRNSLWAAYKAVKSRREQMPAPTPMASSEMPAAIVDNRRKPTDWE